MNKAQLMLQAPVNATVEAKVEALLQRVAQLKRARDLPSTFTAAAERAARRLAQQEQETK